MDIKYILTFGKTSIKFINTVKIFSISLLSTSPVVSDGGTLFAKILTGSNGASGITAAGNLKYWGRNDLNQTGDSTDFYRSFPRNIMPWLSP